MASFLPRLKERKLFHWVLAYLAGAWLVFQGIEVLAEPWHVSEAIQRSIHVLLGIGFLATVVLAWYHGEKGRQRVGGIEVLILTGILVIAGAALALLGRGEDTGPEAIGRQGGAVSYSIDPKSVAVLPFANLSADANNEYFSDGITSDIISHLARSADLHVIARTSVIQYKATEKPIRQVGRELGVAAIVEGEVQRSGHRVRINAQLIDANTDLHLWAGTYNRELTTDNLFEIQSDIAQRIASALQVTLALGNKSRISREPTDSLRAYEYSQRGMYQLYRGYEDDLSQAILMFDSAIAVDPEYAEAYLGLANAWYGKASWYPTPPDEAIAAARSAALRCLELDSTVAGAYAVLANINSWIDWDWEAATSRILTALALNPNDASARMAYSSMLMAFGLRDEAVEQCRRAVALDPLNGAPLQECAAFLAVAGYGEEGLAFARLAVELDERNRWILAVVYFRLGRYGEWFEQLLAWDSIMGRSSEEIRRQAQAVFAEGGQPEILRWWLSRTEGVEDYPPTEIALLHAALGESEEAFDWLERAREQRDPGLTLFLYEPAFVELHGQPRGQTLLETMGLSQGRIQEIVERLSLADVDA